MRDEFFRKVPSLRDEFYHFYPSLRDFCTLLLTNEFMPNFAKKRKFGMNSTYNELLTSKIKAVYMNTKSA